jgi:acyl-coenzyme A thioesterase PaaI-like protein
MQSAIQQHQNELEHTRAAAHPGCIGCSPSHPDGMQLAFVARDDQGVEASFDCPATYEGYPGQLHGGIISLLLDAAMTNCLFSRGRAAVTARLIVRFRHPAATGVPGTVRAWLREDSAPLYVLEAEFEQNGRVVASAGAKFIDRSGL